MKYNRNVMTDKNRENLFLRLSPRLRKQLEILADKDDYSFYEALGLPNQDLTEDDLTRSINRARDLLERLKFHPQYKDESRIILDRLIQAVEILGNPETKLQYDKALLSWLQEGENRQKDRFRHLIEITSEGQPLGPEQKTTLLLYAQQMKIDGETARSILDSYPEQDRESLIPAASPPRLTAPIPRYMETPAFRIILQKSEPLLAGLSTLRCSNCHKENPMTHLVCSCGSLMRGKMICLGCALLFSIKNSQCPGCEKDSHLTLELKQEDIRNIHHYIQHQMDLQQYETALNACRDIMEIHPGDPKTKTIMRDLRKILEAEEPKQEGKNIEEEGIRAWEEKRTYKAYALLKGAAGSGYLSRNGIEILKQASLSISKRILRLFNLLVSFSIILLILLIISFTLSMFEIYIIKNTPLIKLLFYGFAFSLILGLAVRIFHFIFIRRAMGDKKNP
ncbi:hypothetical protein JW926_02915 [Candidatus Sumerlaeota bacterium]|nr:hypothetical protein [Candidatus Sumerlaeota bacterium]